jgi:hypothetical protein
VPACNSPARRAARGANTNPPSRWRRPAAARHATASCAAPPSPTSRTISSTLQSHGDPEPAWTRGLHFAHLLPTGATHITCPLDGLTPESRKPRRVQGFRFKRMKGFEPSTFAMARRRSSQLSYIRAVAHSSPQAAGRVTSLSAEPGSLSAAPGSLSGRAPRAPYPLNVERPASPNGSSRSRTASRNPCSAACCWKA